MKKRNLLQLVALAGIALSAAMNPSTANAGSVVYVATSDNEFGTLNLTTGTFTEIGTFSSLPTGVNIFGMGFGSDGKLYGLDSQLPSNLYQIDITNANLTPPTGTPTSPAQSAIDATADASGKLYVLSQDASGIYYTMTPATTGATTTTVANTGAFGTGVFAVNAAGTQLIMGTFDNTTGNTDINSVNPTTGAVTFLGDSGFANILNASFVNGTLYAFDSAGDILTINTTTGAATKVGTYTLPGGASDAILASAVLTTGVIPEPSSVVMGLIAVVAGGTVGLLRRRPSTAAA
jgi:hypothetical protein